MLYKKEEHKHIQKVYLVVKWGLIFTVFFSLDPYIYTNKSVFIDIMKLVLIAGLVNSIINFLYRLANEKEQMIYYISVGEVLSDLMLVILLAKVQSYYGDGFVYIFLLMLLVWVFIRYGASPTAYGFILVIIGVGIYLYQVIYAYHYVLKDQKFIIFMIFCTSITLMMYSVGKENQRLKMLLRMKEEDMTNLKADVNKLSDLHKVSSIMYETSEKESILFSLMDNVHKITRQSGIKLILYGEHGVESDAISYLYQELKEHRLQNKKYRGIKGFYGQKEFECLRKQKDYKNCLLAYEPIQIHKNNSNLFDKILPNQKEKYIYIFNLIQGKKESGIVVCNTHARLEHTMCKQIDTLVKFAGGALTRAHMLREAKEEAMNDKLTGTKTRRYLDESIKVLENKGNKQPISILFGDIDHFKQFNDNYGHHMGDYVLKEVAHVLSKHATDETIVGRYGGEEFVMLMYGIDQNTAYQIAEGIRYGVSQLSLEKYVGKPCFITISLGIASYWSGEHTLEESIKCADEAMYMAKKTRNAVCVYNKDFLEEKDEN